jgi:uncharacterized phiE125 gp8 family phage protein
MVMMVVETEAIPDEALPVGSLASQLRLPDGWELVPGQIERLAARLRAAIVGLERRLGLMTVSRAVTLAGSPAAARIDLPIWPNVLLTAVTIDETGVRRPVLDARIEEGDSGTVLVLPSAPDADARVRVALVAGFGAWDQVPAPLAQAALIEAEALETGERLAAPVGALIGPWRRMRLGARA